MRKNHTGITIVPVVLCGGSGTRLWPESREKHPKQFLKLIGENSLLQNTIHRALRISGAPAENLVTVTLGALYDTVHEQVSEISPDAAQHILSEPCARDTAAAVAFAATYVRRHFGEDAVMWILPADHHIGDEAPMTEAFHHALDIARKDYLVTFGIRPTRPETGYGYIRMGQALGGDAIYNADAFVEKPDRKTAQSYLDSGDYMWNSGMFLFNTSCVLNQFFTHSPDVLNGVEEAMAVAIDDSLVDLLVYSGIEKQPFDRAIMEKSDHVALVPCDPDWSDIGSWESLWEMRTKDEHGNATAGRVAYHETKNCLIQSKDRLVACAGVEDIVVIETADAVLIADRSNSAAMKILANSLKEAGHAEAYAHPDLSESKDNAAMQKSDSPWQAQEMFIDKGEILTLRAQTGGSGFFTVMQGKAAISVAGRMRMRDAGETVFLKSGQSCTLRSMGYEPLILVSVQQGAGITHEKSGVPAREVA